MPTTIDRFHAVGQMCQNLATMQNNMRSNSQAVQSSCKTPFATSTTVVDAYTAGASTLTVANASIFPPTMPYLITLANPQKTVLNVTGVSGNTLIVSTKQNAAGAPAGATVSLVAALYQDFPATQKAMRDLGVAFNQRLDLNAKIFTDFPTDVQNGAAAIGVSFTDMQNMQSLLRTWANNLTNAVITNEAQLDSGVSALLAAVPAAMLPF